MTTPLDDSPCDHIAVEHIEALLDVSGAVFEDLFSSRFLRPLVAERLRAGLPPLPQNQATEVHELFKFVCMSSNEERAELSRYICVLMNHEAVRTTTNGELLRALADRCSEDTIMYLVCGQSFPDLRSFEVLSSITCENIELYATQVDAWLLGSLPQAYRYRLALRLRPDEQLFSLPLPGDEHDREAFFDLATTACGLWKRGNQTCNP
ncbi:hypothetical protein [Phyllobacterium salinisoli]|uniref:hypothetical protein n=1 Tax=Phyllobacterium salinisoli TaxID=1899321 RepID=UPI0011C06FAB|nr:hypothetical protein [Phyllobacterium salinisoli]